MTTQHDTLDAIVAAAGSCWRPPAVAELTRRGNELPARHQRLAEFLVIPSASRPRLLVPAGSAAAAAEATRRYSHALTWRERLFRTVLTTGLRTHLLDQIVRDRLTVHVPDDELAKVESLQQHLADLLGEEITLSLGVGTPRANRKPVLQAISARTNRSLAFVKVGDNTLTRELIRNEASALVRVAETRPLGLVVPELLHVGPWDDGVILVQSALSTPAWTRPRRGSLPVSAMSSLAAAFDAGTAAVTATKTWELIEQSQQRLTDPARRELFGSAARRFAQAHGDQLIRVAAWHGDWAPWNMAWVGHQVRLWDWERFAEEVPVGFDALHYLLNVDAKQRGWPTALSRIDEHVELASRAMRMRPAEIAATSPFYLLELCRRYLLAASPDTGRSLRRQADTVLAHCIEMTGGARPVLPDWGTR